MVTAQTTYRQLVAFEAQSIAIALGEGNKPPRTALRTTFLKNFADRI